MENNIILFNTDIERCASSVLQDQKEKAESDQEKMDQMHVIKDLGNEIKKSIEKGDLQKFGKWLNVHWKTKKKFTKKMTSDKINELYEIGLNNGALGGKLIGAGGGGFLLFYCDKNKEKLREAMKEKGVKELPIKFDQVGCEVIYNGK